MKFVKTIAVIMSPIIPHWCEAVWEAIGESGFAVKEKWPEVPAENKLMSKQMHCLMRSLKNFRQVVTKSKKKISSIFVMVADKYPEWKNDALDWMQANKGNIEDSKVFMGDLKKWAGSLPDKKNTKNVMQFVSFVRKEYMEGEKDALDKVMHYDQKELFASSITYLQSQLGVQDISVVNLTKDGKPEACSDKAAEGVGPGKPGLFLVS